MARLGLAPWNARVAPARTCVFWGEVIEDDERRRAKEIDVILLPHQAEEIALRLLTGLARVGWKFRGEDVQDDDATA